MEMRDNTPSVAPKPIERWLENFDKRQQSEIQLAVTYARQYGHGTTGHNQLMIIAKFYDLLERYGGDNGKEKPGDS